MHETSLVRVLLEQVVQAALPDSGNCVRTVHVALGPLSGVEPLLVVQAFDRLKLDAGIPAAVLKIDPVPLLAECRQCQHGFEVCNYYFVCPNCASRSVRITQGDEFRLVKLEVEDVEEPTPLPLDHALSQSLLK